MGYIFCFCYVLCAMYYVPLYAQADSVKVKGNTETNYLTFSGNRVNYPASPAEGELFYNSSEKTIKYFDGTQWKAVTGISAASKSLATKVVVASDTAQGQSRADYVCTGTNDQAVINSAISALGTKGGTVYLTEGTYNISGSINIGNSGVSLIGSGRATVLKITSGSSNIKAVNIDGASANRLQGVYVARLRIDGNNKTGVNNTGVFLDYVNDSHLESIWTENISGCGVDLWYGNNNTISGCNLYGCSSSGSIRMTGQCFYNVISGNTTDGPGSGGIVEQGSSPENPGCNIIADNQIHGSAPADTEGWGIALGGNWNNIVSGNTIKSKIVGVYIGDCETIVSNNAINGNKQYGLSSTGTYGIISGNTLEANDTGVVMTHANGEGNNIISSNSISNDYGSSAGKSAAGFVTSCNNLIFANRVWGDIPSFGETYGILLQGGSGNFLSGNLIDGARYEKKIQDNGANQYLDKTKLTLGSITEVNVSTSTYTLNFNQTCGYIKLNSTSAANVDLTLGPGQGLGQIVLLQNISEGGRTFTVRDGLGPVNVSYSAGERRVFSAPYTVTLIWNGSRWLELMTSATNS